MRWIVNPTSGGKKYSTEYRWLWFIRFIPYYPISLKFLIVFWQLEMHVGKSIRKVEFDGTVSSKRQIYWICAVINILQYEDTLPPKLSVYHCQYQQRDFSILEAIFELKENAQMCMVRKNEERGTLKNGVYILQCNKVPELFLSLSLRYCCSSTTYSFLLISFYNC